jgi:hypothetical protein
MSWSPRRQRASSGKDVTLLKAQIALAALGELRSGEREAAAELLAELRRQERPRGRAVTVAVPTPLTAQGT